MHLDDTISILTDLNVPASNVRLFRSTEAILTRYSVCYTTTLKTVSPMEESTALTTEPYVALR